MKIIFLGAPGAGKGTQAERICSALSIPAVSTGDMLRENMRGGTALGESAKGYINAGELVPDGLIIDMVRERLARPDCERGFLLDGFPRTVAQAEALDEMNARIDYVINIDVPDSAIESRMSGRRVCKACGAVYHVKNMPPKTDGVCDKCGGELYQRTDDAPETVLERLAVYHRQTAPLIDYYKTAGILITVDGMDLDKTTKAILKALGAET